MHSLNMLVNITFKSSPIRAQLTFIIFCLLMDALVVIMHVHLLVEAQATLLTCVISDPRMLLCHVLAHVTF